MEPGAPDPRGAAGEEVGRRSRARVLDALLALASTRIGRSGAGASLVADLSDEPPGAPDLPFVTRRSMSAGYRTSSGGVRSGGVPVLSPSLRDAPPVQYSVHVREVSTPIAEDASAHVDSPPAPCGDAPHPVGRGRRWRRLECRRNAARNSGEPARPCSTQVQQRTGGQLRHVVFVPAVGRAIFRSAHGLDGKTTRARRC